MSHKLIWFILDYYRMLHANLPHNLSDSSIRPVMKFTEIGQTVFIKIKIDNQMFKTTNVPIELHHFFQGQRGI